MIALYPGSFDPFTIGHEDIISRAAKTFDGLVVGISEDNAKDNFLNYEQRLNLAQVLSSSFSNIQISCFRGLTVDFAKELGAEIIVRGIRNVTDYESESQMAQLNKQLAPSVETIFLNSPDKYRSISSTLVRQIHLLDGDISSFVSPITKDFLLKLK